MPKKKSKKNKFSFKKSPLFIINIIIILFLLIIIALSIKFYYQSDTLDNTLSIQKQLNKEQEKKLFQEQQAKYFEEKTQAMEIEYVKEDFTILSKHQNVKKERNTFHFIDEDNKTTHILSNATPKLLEIRKTIVTKSKPENIKKLNFLKPIKKESIKQLPKLAIIIDDITTKHQINTIIDISYPITMAFLPPTKRHKDSAIIAQEIDIYMIHLPLEASSLHFEELNTLHINDNINTIEQRIKELKKLYPRAKYINNHTGSKFTADKEAMDKLLSILKKYNYTFLDSRTTAKTVAKKYAKKHKVKYLSRNVFLDNKKDKNYIQKQLRKVVRIAKRDGMAIAIGHPHSITLQTLSQSKHLLQGLDIVFIDKL